METRDNLLYESFKLFAERGFADVSVNDIIKAAGITKGGFYHHFKSKEELFSELLNSYILIPMSQFKDYLAALQGNPDERLDAFFYSYIYIIDEMIKLLGDAKNVYGYYLIYFSAKQYIKDFDKKLSNLYDEISIVIKKILKDKLQDKSLPDIKIDSWSTHILALCEGIFMVWIINRNKDYKDMYIEACEDTKALLSQSCYK
jgi:Transcriptional regulator